MVLPFSGPAGAKARVGVIRGIRKKAKFVSLKKFTNTADNMGLDYDDAEGMKSICSKLKCDVVIKGKVKRKRRRFAISVMVYNGGTGELIGRRGGGSKR